MFEGPTNAHFNNMHNIIACVALVAFSSCLVCYAQSSSQIFNREQLRSLANSLSLPPMNIIASHSKPGESHPLYCWSRPTGCTEAELGEIKWPGCAKFRLNPKTNRVICLPYRLEPTTTTTTTTTMSPTLPEQQEESAQDVVTMIPDFEATFDSLIRSIELKRLQLEQLKHLQEQQKQHYYAQQAEYEFDAEMGAKSALDEMIDVQLESNEPDESINRDNSGCKDSNYNAFGCNNNRDSSSSSSMGSAYDGPNIEPQNRIASFISGSGDMNDGGLSELQLQQQQHKLATRAWRSSHEQDFIGRYQQQQQLHHHRRQQQAVGSPHHQQFGMTADEAAKRLAESGKQQEFDFLDRQEQESTTSSKVPIILLKFGAIQNQRRSSDPAMIRGNTVLSPIRMFTYPTLRLQRSDLNNLTQLEQLKFVKGVDLAGGLANASGGQSNRSLVNRTLAPGNEQQREPEVGPVASAASVEGYTRQPPAQQQLPATTEESTPLECTMRRYTFKAVKTDSFGNKCSGLVSSSICYGSCETGEIADWLFPHKKAIHKVCTHGSRIRRATLLTDCSSPNVESQLREYHYVDAKSCVCQKCTSQDTNCLGSLTRPYLGNLDESGQPTSLSSSTQVD